MDSEADAPAAVSGRNQQADLERRVRLPVPLLQGLKVQRGIPPEAPRPEAPGRFVLEAELQPSGLLADLLFG